MKISELWLREITGLDQKISTAELILALTNAGLEVDSVEPVANRLENIVVGRVINVEKHPDAERLHVCQVDIGDSEPLTIVCGAKNVAVDMKVAVALIGGCVGEVQIKKAKLRGVESSGMICSSTELGLTETSEGIMPLPSDAPIGKDIKEYLQLNDNAIVVELTPNRGDCLSLAGLAREVRVLFNLPIPSQNELTLPVTSETRVPVKLIAADACPHYVGRVVENVNIHVPTPLWMKERLRRCGLRSIDPIVDVMNYVMLELGQPLHAFDLDQLSGEIHVRYAKNAETITLLDEQRCQLDDETLIIADNRGPLAIAGIMGSKESAVSQSTKRIFIESAYFDPKVITKKARYYGLSTDASYRFERGVDYQLQRYAVERATELLLSITQGSAGPLVEEVKLDSMPQTKYVILRFSQIKKILGIDVEKQQVLAWFKQLGLGVLENNNEMCKVRVPSYRFDIAIEEDLVEEVARLYDLNKIPSQCLLGELQVSHLPDDKLSIDQIRQCLIERDYHEAVTYSFIAPELQTLLGIENNAIPLINPLSADLAVMRTSLIPSLLSVVQYNQARQQSRLRFFEIARAFHASAETDTHANETLMLAGVCTGPIHEEQWGSPTRSCDFFDVKADIEALLFLTAQPEEFRWEADNIPMMHPGQCAAIYRNDKKIGILGALHPKIAQKLDISASIYIFEFNFNHLATAKLPEFAKLSKYPSVKRDIAFFIEKKITASELFHFIQHNSGEWLTKLQLFDVYEGMTDTAGMKSLAFSLTLQHPSRTLQDSEIDELINQLVNLLKQQYAITLRDGT